MATAPLEGPSAELIFDTLNAYQRSAALRAAIELDLFQAIGEGLGNVVSLARQCSASERGIRTLCDYLTYTDLADIVRKGGTVLPGQGSVEPENPVWVEFAHSMAPMMGPVAVPLAALVLEGLAGPVRVLDIAAGHGLFGIEVAKLNPEARITGLDWAPVLAVAQGNAHRAGVGDRYDLLPGSAFDVEYGGPYDIVLLTNFLHHFDPPTCVGLLKKVRAALKAGGRAATLEFVPNEDRISPPLAAAFSLIMLASTVAGDAYTFRELEAMYREAGFDGITAHPMPIGVQTVVLGRVSV
jgi:2-polyprenyl-3-methyl-5-hydroxy-6-metoxy-1,4-benzoquinol methylase